MYIKDETGNALRWSDGRMVIAIRVSVLRNLLAQLEGDPLLYVNRVGNINITVSQFDDPIGYIDLASEVIEMVDEPTPPPAATE